MAIDNSLDCGEPNPSAFERLLRVLALEYTEQLVFVLHVKTDSVILNKHDEFLRRVVQPTDFYLSLGPRSSEFHRVRNEITEHQPEQGRITVANRQSPNPPNNFPRLRVRGNFADHGFHQLPKIDSCFLRFGPTDPREGQKIVHQAAHTGSRVENHADVVPTLVVQDGVSVLLQELGESGNMPNRRTQIVRDGIRKRLQFFVCGLQLVRTVSKLRDQSPPLLHFRFEQISRLPKVCLSPAPHHTEPNQKPRKQGKHRKVSEIFTRGTETVERWSEKVIEEEFSDYKCDDRRPRSGVPTR